MEANISTELFCEDSSVEKNILNKGRALPQLLFEHPDFESVIDQAEILDQQSLANMINHIHFTENHLLVKMCDPRYRQGILVIAHPRPCLGEDLTCIWSEKNPSGLNLKDYEFQYLVIDDGRSLTLVPGILLEIDENRFKVRLPEDSYIMNIRKMRRYKCQGIVSQLTQNGLLAVGELLDFTPSGFRILAWTEPSYSFHWFNPDEISSVQLRTQKQLIFSGQCRCIRQINRGKGKEIVLAPVCDRIERFPKKQPRTLRQQLIPSPNLVFNHPILNRRVEFRCLDISTSGFSVHEMNDDSVLIPGMIIPEMEICFAGSMKLRCTGQVIHQSQEQGKGYRCGIAILDMDINSYSRLTQVLCRTIEPNTYISNEVDMDTLWEFFFNTGFIYPKKYRLIHSRKENFKDTYRKLYQESPEIAKHFTYQENGKVYAHISMIRAYERAWMMQHHAARIKDNKRKGFTVLKQLINYLNDMYRLPSANMEHLVAYFRPDNRFPEKVFGGFTRQLNNPKGSSMDTFAYLSHTSLSLGTRLPDGWVLQKSTAIDLWHLTRYYNHTSDGLLLDAIGLNKGEPESPALEDAYDRIGFQRRWYAYSLLFQGELNAVLIVEQSDLGINLSELLSGIKVIVTNSGGLPYNILSIAISTLTGKYSMERVPVLFYPLEYVEEHDIPFEKKYIIWALNVEFGNEFMEYMHKRYRINYYK